MILFQIEAKSVEHIKNVNKGLENKIIELQQKLDVRVLVLVFSEYPCSVAIHVYKTVERDFIVWLQISYDAFHYN